MEVVVVGVDGHHPEAVAEVVLQTENLKTNNGNNNEDFETWEIEVLLWEIEVLL